MKRLILTLTIALSAICAIEAEAQTMFTHPWQGKRIAYFGDSITDPRVKAGNTKWWSLLSEWLQATSYCYAISGRQWNDIPRQTDALMKEHGQDVDAILIFIGTNDYNHAIPLGEWYDIEERDVTYTKKGVVMTEKRKHRQMSMDEKTYRGRINIALKKIKQLYPTKQVVLLTPIHRAFFASGEKNIQPDELYPNALGLWIDDYIDAVKQAGNIWAVPVIDLHAVCGLYPLLDEHAQFFSRADTDRLHPNDAGYNRIAKTIYYQLLALPCAF